ncbi:hypothetical protein [Kibdelosporangium philippinense]
MPSNVASYVLAPGKALTSGQLERLSARSGTDSDSWRPLDS